MTNRVERAGPVSLIQANRLGRMLAANDGRIGMLTQVLPMILEIKGSLTPYEARECVAWLVDRHEALRTSYSLDSGELVQRVRSPTAPHLEHVDARSLETDDAMDAARRVFGELVAAPFSPSDELMLRAGMVTLRPDRHLLGIAVEHIAFDQWSAGPLVADIESWLASAGVPDVPPAPRYLDWAQWQRDYLSESRRAEAIAYWRSVLGPDGPFPDNPLFVSGGEEAAKSPVSETRRLDAGSIAALRGLNATTGGTAFMTVLGLLQLAVARVTGLERVVVHSPTANRAAPGSTGLVGWLAHGVVYPLEIDAEACVGDLLRCSADTALDSYARQDLPLPEIVRVLSPSQYGPSRALRPPRVYLGFADESAPLRSAAGDRSVSTVPNRRMFAGSGRVEPGVSFYTVVGADGGTIEARFPEAEVDHALVLTVLDAFESLLSAAASGTRTPLSDVALPVR